MPTSLPNFNFLSVSVSEIKTVSQNLCGATSPLPNPVRWNFYVCSKYLARLNSAPNFSIISLCIICSYAHMWGDILDVITCAIFRDCRLRGVGVVRGVSLPSPIDFTRRPYNTGHTTVWPCDISIFLQLLYTRWLAWWQMLRYDNGVENLTASTCPS